MTINLHPLSLTSIFVEQYFNDQKLGLATGFIIKKDERLYLVTNWHVVSGRNAETDKCLDKKEASIPNKLKISLPQCDNKPSHKISSFKWTTLEIPLYLDNKIENDSKLWIEHSDGRQVDVVLLPIQVEIQDRFVFDLSLADADMVLEPAMPVSIIGFPFGRFAGGRLPIWVTGFVASEPDVNAEENRPLLYVNALGRSGLSGSPVVLKSDIGFRSSRGWEYATSRMRFIGINSGRIASDEKTESSDICRVWKPIVIEQILNKKDQKLSQ